VAVTDLLKDNYALLVENERGRICGFVRRIPTQAIQIGHGIIRIRHENDVGFASSDSICGQSYLSAFNCLEDRQRSLSWSTVSAPEGGSSLPSQGKRSSSSARTISTKLWGWVSLLSIQAPACKRACTRIASFFQNSTRRASRPPPCGLHDKSRWILCIFKARA
jgi:hypothetical protein